MPTILAIDQSTSATKALLFDQQGQLVDQESKEHRQYYPQPGWVEHDAEEIYANTLEIVAELLRRHQPLLSRPSYLSITNQRETVVVFERETGQPLHHALVWQCRRGNPLCESLVSDGHASMVTEKTGLKIDTYFSASKLKWLVDNVPQIRRQLASGQALIGTIDTYLLYRLTGGRVFATDHTNACRTLLFDIGTMRWDEQLCSLFDVPLQALPEIRESSAAFGETDFNGILDVPMPICGVMGDSQAALFAQSCFLPGTAKVTFGTGSSVLLNIGEELQFSENGIVTTLAWVHDGRPTYAFEGILNYTGATVAWLQNQLQLIETPTETETLARSVPDNGGVYLVPAFIGLGAPYWKSDAKGALLGLTPHSTRAHVARAALESIAYQVKDVLDLMVSDSDVPLQSIRGDGGMVRNGFLMQFVADMIGFSVIASGMPALSALGAVFAGMLGRGEVAMADLPHIQRDTVAYAPEMKSEMVSLCYNGWKDAVACVL